MKNNTRKRKKLSMIWKIPSEQFESVVRNARTLKEVLDFLGRSGHSRGSYTTLKERIKEDNIDISHMHEGRKQVRVEKLRIHNTIPLSEILVENSTYLHTTDLKKRLLKEGLLIEKCYKCGLGNEWEGEPLSLQLDHENGVHNDNRIENLRLLCPNCHSQTITFSGRNNNSGTKRKKECTKCEKVLSKNNKTGYCLSCHNRIFNKSISQRKVERPSKEELLQLILIKPFIHIASDYEVSDNAIRKWCKYYDLPYRKKDIEEYKKTHVLMHN